MILTNRLNLPSSIYNAVAREKFWRRVNKTDGCWEWCGTIHLNGYGAIGVAGKKLYAHRIAYELSVGPIPAGMFVCHRCDNPKCVRPDHLFAGTPGDNNRDKKLKGRQHRGEKTGGVKLTEAQVSLMRRTYPNPKQDEIKKLARYFGVHRMTITRIFSGESWSHL